MLVANALYSALQKAESPRAVRALSWALEKSTGYKTADLLTFSPGDLDGNWYAQNGYNRLAGFGGRSSWAGVTVNEDRAFQVTAFYAGVKLISEDLGALPHHVYERSKDRKSTDKAYTHTLYRCLHDIWNPEVSAGEGVESLTSHALVTGAGYAEIQRLESGTFLWPWQPEDVRIDRNDRGRGALFYIHRENGRDKTYTRDQVFHLKGFTMDTVNGENTLSRMRQVLGIAGAADEYVGRFFAQDAAPGIVISFPATAVTKGPEQVKAIKDAWIKWHRGVSKSHDPAIVQEGATVSRVGWNNQEAQLKELREYQLAEVCRVLRLPPHKLADLTRSTNNNIEQQGIEYVVAITPWIDRWKRATYRCLLTFDEQMANRIYAEMDVAGLQRGDFATQAEGWRKLLEKGVYSINEIRRWLNLNPVPGGDEHFIQLNLGTVQDVASGATLATNRTGTMPISGVTD